MNKKTWAKIKKGFTLVELILYIGLISTVLISMSMLFSVILQTRIRNQAISEVDQQGYLLLETISYTIRNGVDINSPTIVAVTGTSLSIKTNALKTNPIVFSMSSGKIQMQEGTGVVLDLTSNKVTASGLIFKNVTGSASTNLRRTIKFEFKLTHINLNNRPELAYSQTFYGSANIR